MQIIIGCILGAGISFLAWRVHALSGSGAMAAALVGSALFGLGGFPWATVLLAFFITSSGLSRFSANRKASSKRKVAKGNRRDWGQVFANGGLGTLMVVVYGLAPGQSWTWFAFIGAMAAANADTWATELGMLSSTPPRLITNGKVVERGVSGGVTATGLLASLLGALLIGGVAALFSGPQWGVAWVAAAVGGTGGSLVDSLLGATVQAIYRCPVCEEETEHHPLHSCGSATYQVRGWQWLNNDAVNVICTLCGALLAYGLWRMLAL